MNRDPRNVGTLPYQTPPPYGSPASRRSSVLATIIVVVLGALTVIPLLNLALIKALFWIIGGPAN